MSKRKTTEEFITDAIKIHGEKYNYSNIEYPKNNKTKILFKCNICNNFFEQTPHDHLSGYGCPHCAKNKKKTTEEFILEAQKIHGNKYDYNKVTYKNKDTKVCIICPKHGEFWMTPHNHLQGKQNCPFCKGENVRKRSLKTKEQFIKESISIHGNKYDYSKVEYINNQTKVCIICPKHGEFWQAPYHHLNKHGCPYCKNSILEEEIERLLVTNNINFEREKKFEWLKSKKQLRLDFFLPDYNVAIECQGIQHFKPINFGSINNTNENVIKQYNKTIERDTIKYDLCKKNGIKILYYGRYNNSDGYTLYNDKKELLKIIQNEKVS